MLRSVLLRMQLALPQSSQFSTAAKQAEPPAKVGFIGLGNMGYRMAVNLMHAGHSLVVYDTSAPAMNRMQEAGAEVGTSPQDVAETASVKVIVTMLPSSHHVRQVYCGQDGILQAQGGVRPSLLIDSSTIDPPTAMDIARAVAATKLHRHSLPMPNCSAAHPAIVDAPVSGGVGGAKAATLTFMCGGEEAAVRAAESYLKAMGKRTVHCGPSGNGQAAKVCNNLVLGISMAAVAEGLALGKSLGLDPKLLSDIFNSSSARCWSSDSYNPCPGVMEGVPASRNYKGGFGCSLMVKDLGLAQTTAEHVDLQLHMGPAALSLYQHVVDKVEDGSHEDFSSIYRHVYREGNTKRDF